MGEIHFLEHYRYRQFVRVIQDTGIFPTCPFHPLSHTHVLGYLDQLRNKKWSVDRIVRVWEAISHFCNFYFRQPFQKPLEMHTPYDFSRYVNDFLPIYLKEAKGNKEVYLDAFEKLIGFFDYLFKQGVIGTVEAIRAARQLVFSGEGVSRIERGQLLGPEWSVVIASPINGEQLVFTFTDLWLLVALKTQFDLDAERMKRCLEDPDMIIEDRLNKRAHFSRLIRRIRLHYLGSLVFINGLMNQSTIRQSKRWLYEGKYHASLV